MNKPTCVTFAGVVGSSKTPVAYHLSYTFGLPIFNNDAIRAEVKEDLLKLDMAEYENRRSSRLAAVFSKGKSFIYDASVDRKWPELKAQLADHGYDHFIISLDLSFKLLQKMLKAKAYNESLDRLNELIARHNDFLNTYISDIGLHITDKTFANRLKLVEEKLKNSKFS